MNRIIKIAIIVLSGIAIVIGGMFLFPFLYSESSPDSCQDALDSFAKRMEAVCPAEYLEWGYDSPERCINGEIGLFDPIECELG